MGKKATIAITALVVCGALYGNAKANDKLNGVDKQYIMQNVIGTPLTAEIGPEAVKVAISDSFTEEQKEHIKTAIEEFDFDVKGVKYQIIMNETVASPISDLNCIHIRKTSEFSHNVQEATEKNYDAKTSTIHNPFSGKIVYPVNINMHVESLMETANSHAGTQYFLDRKNEVEGWRERSSDYYLDEKVETLFKRVVKHEMLHTLGLADIYDENMEEKTIMYGENSFYAATDLTEHDKHIVNTLYTAIEDDQEVTISSTVELPKEVKIPKSYLKQVENEKVPFSAEEMEM